MHYDPEALLKIWADLVDDKWIWLWFSSFNKENLPFLDAFEKKIEKLRSMDLIFSIITGFDQFRRASRIDLESYNSCLLWFCQNDILKLKAWILSVYANIPQKSS